MSPHADTVRSLLSRGWHHAQIADRLHMSRSNVSRIAASLGVSRYQWQSTRAKQPKGGRGIRCRCGARLRFDTDPFNFGRLVEWCPKCPQGCVSNQRAVG